MSGALAVVLALVPLTQLGLYENGSNTPPADHLNAGLAHAAVIAPLDREGRTSPSGKIVLISIGMSNTTQEFCSANGARCETWSFVGQAAADPAVNHTTLVFANGARGGQTADTWDSPTDTNYLRIRDQVLTPAGLTEEQVQVAWVKVANAQPRSSLPVADADAYRLVTQMGNIARALKTRYRNLRIAYFSSRTYGGYATTTLNPEPYAYESGLAVKWLVQAQIDQMRTGRIDTRAGNLDANSIAPWIAWGPYLWDDTWVRDDFDTDGTHPSASGERKAGALLLAFLKTEPTARGWFLAPSSGPRRRAVRR